MIKLFDKLFDSLKIKYKILALLSLPFASFTTFAVVEVVEHYQKQRYTEGVAYYHEHAIHLLDIMIGLQKEEGYIRAYRNSGNSHFLLSYQRHKEILNPLLNDIKTLLRKEGQHIKDIDADLKALINHLEQIDKVRKGIELGGVPTQPMIITLKQGGGLLTSISTYPLRIRTLFC